MIVVDVAAKAVIVNDKGEVLIVRESPDHKTNDQVGRYGLPGGRLEPGEVFFETLMREVEEETGLKVTIGRPLLVGEWRPTINGVPHQIVGMFMACRASSGATVHLSEENDDYQWINPSARAAFDIVEPDWMAIDAYATDPRV
jgi:8-oxo-dGTP diphosphatase